MAKLVLRERFVGYKAGSCEVRGVLQVRIVLPNLTYNSWIVIIISCSSSTLLQPRKTLTSSSSPFRSSKPALSATSSNYNAYLCYSHYPCCACCSSRTRPDQLVRLFLLDDEQDQFYWPNFPMLDSYWDTNCQQYAGEAHPDRYVTAGGPYGSRSMLFVSVDGCSNTCSKLFPVALRPLPRTPKSWTEYTHGLFFHSFWIPDLNFNANVESFLNAKTRLHEILQKRQVQRLGQGWSARSMQDFRQWRLGPARLRLYLETRKGCLRP